MAPKKNKQREKQEQNKASSSARAHESLTKSLAGAHSMGFIGFSAFATSPSVEVAEFGNAETTTSFYDGSDHEIAMALKMLGKKGTVTKIKALQSFLNEILPPKKPIEIRPMMAHFLYLYANEMRDQNDRKVRQLLNEVLRLLTQKLKMKAFAPHLKRLMPFWFMAMHDPHADVSTMAKEALETLSPETKDRLEVICEHLDAMLQEFTSFFTKTPAQFDGITMSPEEQEERYVRCVTAAIASIDTLVQQFAAAQQIEKLQASSIPSMVSSIAFGRLVSIGASKTNASFTRDAIRKATYRLLTTICTKAPSLIPIDKHEAVGKLILGSFSDKAPANHDAMWNAVLSYLMLPTTQQVWQNESFVKFVQSAVFPRLYVHVRHGFYGSTSTSFPSLLPFLSVLPLSVILNRKTGVCELYKSLLEHSTTCLKSNEARGNETAVITAFFECLTACFSVFLTSNVAELQEFPSEAYVNQFQQAIQLSLRTVMNIKSQLNDASGHWYLDQVAAMLSRLSATDSNEVIASLRGRLIVLIKQWCCDVITELVQNQSCSPSRLAHLIRALQGNNNNERMDHSWKSAFQQVYRQSLTQMEENKADPSALVGLLELCTSLMDAMGLEALLDGEASIETHYELRFRPVIRQLGPQSIALKIFQGFLLLVNDKKALLLQLIEDLDLQYGDLVKATAMIRHGMQFSFDSSAKQVWSSCGSFESSAAPTTTSNATNTLALVWKSKLMDEFLLISLRGRLDDLDGDAFQGLLQSCLGQETLAPVVSVDAFLVVAHFAIKQAENMGVFMRMVPSLLALLKQLRSDRVASPLPEEVGRVEYDLVMKLFHLRVESPEADALWTNKAMGLVHQWEPARQSQFSEEIASELNQSICTSDAIAWKQTQARWIATAKKYLLLSNEDIETLVNRLHVLRLSSVVADHYRNVFDRVLVCWSGLCADDRIVQLAAPYLAQNQELCYRLLDIDMCHALTWWILEPSNPHDHDYSAQCFPVDVVKEYLSLDGLWEQVTTVSHLRQLLAPFYDVSHRSVVFMNQNTESGDPNEPLTTMQTQALNRLHVELLASYVPALDKLQLLNEDGLWQTNEFVSLLESIGNKQDDSFVSIVSERLETSIEHLAECTAVVQLIDPSTHEALLQQVQDMFASGSTAAVSVERWIEVVDYLCALAPLVETLDGTIQSLFATACRLVIVHALSGKQAVAALKLHQHKSKEDDDERFVVSYPLDLLRCRTSMLRLAAALGSIHEGAAMQELASHHREALVSTAMCTLGDALRVRGHVVSTYVTLQSPVQSLSVITLGLAIENTLSMLLKAMPVVVSNVPDKSIVQSMFLDAIGGLEHLGLLLDPTIYRLKASTRSLLYALVSYTHAYRSKPLDLTSIDMNADDEVATEQLIVNAMVPQTLQDALQHAFAEEQATKKSKKKQQEDNRDYILHQLLVWDLFLQFFPSSLSDQNAMQNNGSMVSSALSAYASQHGLIDRFLDVCGALLAQEAISGMRTKTTTGLQDAVVMSMDQLSSTSDLSRLATQVFFRTVLRLPTMVRAWYNDKCTRSLRSWATKYFEEYITPYIFALELEIIQKASQTHAWDMDEMTVKGSKVSREITTTYMKDECALEMVLRVPSSYPLRSIEVECTKRIGISEDRWRRWVLQIVKVTSSQDGSLLDAVMLWKRNVDQEFDGVEPCPICYSILNPKTMGLPNLPCKTCSNKYHNSCLYKWFNQSGKNKCPICQQPFC